MLWEGQMDGWMDRQRDGGMADREGWRMLCVKPDKDKGTSNGFVLEQSRIRRSGQPTCVYLSS